VHLQRYLHPLKVALICTTAALIVVLPPLRDVFPYGLWAAIVVTLIRQESSASSFHRGYQRVEGTLLGSLFAFSVARLLQCADTVPCSDRDPAVMLPLLVAWIGLCALFREDAQHGYASLVAGFTPIVVLLGPVREGSRQDAAWARVEMTFLGVFLYLLLDNAILPSRSDHDIRALAVQGVGQVRSVLGELSGAMRVLMVVGGQEEQEQEEEGAGVVVVASKQGSEDEDGNLLGAPTPAQTAGRGLRQAPRLGPLLASYAACLARAQAPLVALRQSVARQRALFSLACNEPQLWHR
jgi:hypothetical protein